MFDFIKNLFDDLVKLKTHPLIITLFIAIIGFLSYIMYQVTNHLPTHIKEIKQDIYRLDNKITEVRLELKQDIHNVKTELKQDIQNVRTELKQDINRLDTKIDKQNKTLIEILKEIKKGN